MAPRTPKAGSSVVAREMTGVGEGVADAVDEEDVEEDVDVGVTV